jgi:hypothetical protein
MATCPNKNLDEWKSLVASRGENIAYYLWDKYEGNVPEFETNVEIVKSELKAVNILQSPKADQFFNAVAKNKISGDFFWRKMQADLGIPKEQIDLLKSFDTTDREQLITNMLANYSYTVEINITKNKETTLDFNDPRIEFIDNTRYYADLTVPGGTNYTENEIATPAITPNIKGHAQFATDQGIGWFRSDDKTNDTFTGETYIDEEYGFDDNQGGQPITKEVEKKVVKQRTPTKTRRVLEVQSDLFQKGREKEKLTKFLEEEDLSDDEIKQITNSLDEIMSLAENKDRPFWDIIEEGREVNVQKIKKYLDEKNIQVKPKNTFLQLLNKNNNWVTFFIKSIIQDSAKKGYEKVLFPSGDTASKIEGHQTLEEFETQKLMRISDLEQELDAIKRDEEDPIPGVSVDNTQRKKAINSEISQLKQEIERVREEGFGALKPIYNFYENTVANVLKKQGYNPRSFKDEYGNTWNQIEIVPERENQPILFQLEDSKMSPASPEILSKVKDILKKMGVNVESLTDYAKKSSIKVSGVNAVADLVRGVIAVAEGKENVALTEEMVHIATAIIEQKNPTLVTEMIAKIDRFKIYKQTLEQYKDNKYYQLPNGKPDIRKIKKEAVDRLIAELIVNGGTNNSEFPELQQEENTSLIRRWWNAITDFFRGMYKSANIDIFQEAATQIMEGGVERQAPYIKEGVEEIFSSNPELAEIGSPELYSQYLDSIFPGSQVKDIVYHGSNQKIEQFEIRKEPLIHFGTKTAALQRGNILNRTIINVQDLQPIKDGMWFLGNERGGLLKELLDRKILTSKEVQSINEVKIQAIENSRYFNENYRMALPDGEKAGNKKLQEILSEKNIGFEYINFSEDEGSTSYAVPSEEQIHVLGNQKDIEGFRQFVETRVSREGIFLQVAEPTKAQKDVQRRILETENYLEKVPSKDEAEADPLLTGDAEENNFYRYKRPDGNWERVTKRVTDRVKRWYKRKFGEPKFTKEEQEFNEFKRKLGVKYHGYFEEIHFRYFNPDGTKKTKPDARPKILNSDNPTSKVDNDIYTKLENYYVALINKYSEGGNVPLVFSEVKIYDPVEKEAGTIDLLIVDEDGTGHIIDWKFMTVGEGQNDIQWYKQQAYGIQLSRYRNILLENYGVKKIGNNRAIPILFKIQPAAKKVEGAKPTLSGVSVGSVNTSEIQDLTLLPISEKTESTGYEKLDELIVELNSVLDKIANSKATSDEEREFKRERLTLVREAIRYAQGTLNIKPVVDVVKIMRQEGENLINDYNMIYKNADPRSKDFTNKQLSEFSSNLRDYIAIADVFGTTADKIGKLIYDEKADNSEMSEQEIAERKEILSNLQKETTEIRLSKSEVLNIANKFGDKFMGIRNLISGLLEPEAVVKGFTSFFRSVSEIPLKSVQIMVKLVENARLRATKDAVQDVDKLMKIREKLAARGGDLRKLVQQIYQKDKDGNLVNKLIYKYDPKFYDEVKNNAMEGRRSMKWLRENIDVQAYEKDALPFVETLVARIKKDHADDEETMDRLVQNALNKWDIRRPTFNGWDNYRIMRYPLAKWESAEYIELKNDPELLDLYEFISGINNTAKEVGYLQNQATSTFLPWVRKSMAESLAWDFNISAINNWTKSLSVRADDVGYGKIDALTKEVEYGIPKYYTTNFTELPDGQVDTSEVSEDLFANMILYINHLNKYKYLVDIEDQLQLIKTIEKFKTNHLKTSSTGSIVIENGRPDEGPSDGQNMKVYDQFMRALLYDQKYPLDQTDVTISTGVVDYFKKAINKVSANLGGQEMFTVDDQPSSISLVKSMETLNRFFQLKSLGFEFISGAVNWFGTNVQVAAQSGAYFTRTDVLKKQYQLLGNKFKPEEREMFIQLVNTFMPLREDPNYQKFKDAGMSELTKLNFGDMLMFFMREPEQLVEKAIFSALLDNVMVENGKLVNIRDFVKKKYASQRRTADSILLRDIKKQMESEIEELKKTRSVNAIKKLEDGKLVIPGFDLNNFEAVQELTKLTRKLSTNATGGVNQENLNRAQMNVWYKSALIFKNWIPGLAFTRFDHLRKVSDDFSVMINEDGLTEGEKYDIGRLRLFVYVMGTSIVQKANNINNILQLNEKGVAELDRMFEKFAYEYYMRTGETLKMNREDFIDLIQTNLKNQLRELQLTASLFAATVGMGVIGPDDDDSRAEKNTFRFAQRVLDKFVSELTFFINPFEFQDLLQSSAIPSIGVVTDLSRFVTHFAKEITGFDISDPTKSIEDVRKDAQPIKNLAKMFPVSKSLINYLAMIDEDFAKEFDITIQKESNR